MHKLELTESIIEFASKENAKTTKDYLDRDEKSALVKDCGLDGFFLFDHYINKAHIKNPNLDDTHIASLLDCGWSPRRVQTVRLKLVKKGWMYVVKYHNQTSGQNFTKIILGKSLVDLNHNQVKIIKAKKQNQQSAVPCV